MMVDLERLANVCQVDLACLPSEGVGPIGAEEGIASSSSRPRFVPLAVDGPTLLGVSTSGPNGELVHY